MMNYSKWRFCDYVTTTWVDPLVARFPIEIWNNYAGLHIIRTTNHLESWHNKMNRELGRPHPNLFRAIELFKEQQAEMEETLRLLQASGRPPIQRRKYRLVTERLVRLKARLERGEVTAHHYAGAVGGILSFHFN